MFDWCRNSAASYADLQKMRKWCGWCVVLATMDGHDLGRWNRPFAKSGMPRSCMICIQIESESYLFCLLPAAVQGVSAILTPNGARRHRGCSVELLLKTLKRELLKWRCWLGHSSWMIVSCHRLLRQLELLRTFSWLTFQGILPSVPSKKEYLLHALQLHSNPNIPIE